MKSSNTQSSSRHVLMVAFHYPPESSSSGVLRTLKFSRYLLDHGWRVSVLTVAPSAYLHIDLDLEKQVPDAVRVVRTDYVELRNRLSLLGRYPAIVATPDAWIGWYPYAIRGGRNVARQDPVHAVFSTSPYATAHLIGMRLASLLRVPWVMDFRDPWYEDPPEPGTPGIVHAAARRLESISVRRAAHVVASTRQLRDLLADRYRDVPRERFSVIMNGYDEADFAALPPSTRPVGQRLTLLHAGSINAEFRDPRPLVRSVARLIRQGLIGPEGIEIKFIGAGSYSETPELLTCIEESGLSQVVKFTPRVGYRESLQAIAGAGLLLLLQSSPDTAALVPAKLYEYLRVGRPVLALTTVGATADVVNEVGGGWCVDPQDSDTLDRTLAEVFRLHLGGTLGAFGAEPQKVGRFDRRALTARLAAVLDQVST